MTKQMKIYIAGKMRGIPLYNFPMFDAVASSLRREGWDVVSPAEMDREAGLIPRDLPPDHDWSQLPPATSSRDFASRDLGAIADCDAIYMLDGWEKSVGARAERAVAQWIGLDILYQTTPTPRKHIPIASGVLNYFPDAIRAVAHCSWVGNEQHNSGEPLHWSRDKSNDHADCMMRHFMERGTVDEDGVRHMTKTVWRALALLQLEIEEARDE